MEDLITQAITSSWKLIEISHNIRDMGSTVGYQLNTEIQLKCYEVWNSEMKLKYCTLCILVSICVKTRGKIHSHEIFIIIPHLKVLYKILPEYNITSICHKICYSTNITKDLHWFPHDRTFSVQILLRIASPKVPKRSRGLLQLLCQNWNALLFLSPGYQAQHLTNWSPCTWFLLKSSPLLPLERFQKGHSCIWQI